MCTLLNENDAEERRRLGALHVLQVQPDYEIERARNPTPTQPCRARRTRVDTLPEMLSFAFRTMCGGSARAMITL